MELIALRGHRAYRVLVVGGIDGFEGGGLRCVLGGGREVD